MKFNPSCGFYVRKEIKIILWLVLFPCLAAAQPVENHSLSGGCVVGEVREGSAAAAAGVRLGDVITEANQTEIRTVEDLRAAVKGASDELLFTVRRGTSTENLIAHLPSSSVGYRFGVGCGPESTTDLTPPSGPRVLVTFKAGDSLFTGLLGVEVQRNHLAFDFGLPTSGGIRYYFRPQGHSWFAGLYGSGYGYDHDETKDGIAYTHYSNIGGGVGAGYRWLWRSRWNLELGATAGYEEEYWTNSYVTRWQKSIIIGPNVLVGFSFK